MTTASIARGNISLCIVDLLVPVILTELDDGSTPLVNKSVSLTLDSRSHSRLIHLGVKVYNTTNFAVDKVIRLNGELVWWILNHISTESPFASPTSK